MSRARDIADGTLNSADINGGTIDSTTIGGTTPAAGTFTTFTSTGIDDNASSTALTIDSSGKVGIGTSSPVYTVSVGDGSDATQYVDIKTTNTGSGGLLFSDADANAQGRIEYVHSDDSMRLRTSSTERMRIDSNGNVQLTGSLTAGTLGSGVTFPSKMIVKTYYAEYTNQTSTTYASGTWHDIPSLSITTDVPKSTSSNFLLFGSTHFGATDWAPKVRFYNNTTSTAIGVGTNPLSSQVPSSFIGNNFHDNQATIFGSSGFALQTGNTGVAQTFKLQAYSGRNSFYINRAYLNNNDDISGNATISTLIVMEIA